MPSTTMNATTAEVAAKLDDVGRMGHGGQGGDNGGTPGSFGWSVPARTYKTGMWLALGAIVMFFAAFTSALVVRRGLSDDWVAIALPRVLWLNTAVLLASSLTLELSRRSHHEAQFLRWLNITAALGLLFLGGQLLAWRELASRGVYLATNPSSSFFYLLTAAHGVHLLGGIIALAYLVLRARRMAAVRRAATVDVTALYWHFMDGLWIYILLLLGARF